MEISRWLLFFFNLIFAICGVIILVVGIVAEVKIKANQEIFGFDFFWYASVVLIVIGLFIFTLSFLGCCGAATKSHCMLMTFAGILLTIFVAQLVVGIGGLVKLNSIKADTVKSLNETMKNYKTDVAVKSKFDHIQRDYDCCGIKGPEDWKSYGMEIPESCCEIKLNGKDTNATCTAQSPELYHKGCATSFTELLYGTAVLIGCVALCTSFVQITGAVIATRLANSVRNEYSSFN